VRRILLPAVVALALAIGLVLVLAGGEEDVVVEPGTGTAPGTETAAEPEKTTSAEQPAPSDEVDEIEQAVTLYIEAAETGQVEAPPGLPTSDELSIEEVSILDSGATVRLTGGASIFLRKRKGRWHVVRATPGRARPTPPSNG
jgi:hypothetical protein